MKYFGLLAAAAVCVCVITTTTAAAANANGHGHGHGHGHVSHAASPPAEYAKMAAEQQPRRHDLIQLTIAVKQRNTGELERVRKSFFFFFFFAKNVFL